MVSCQWYHSCNKFAIERWNVLWYAENVSDWKGTRSKLVTGKHHGLWQSVDLSLGVILPLTSQSFGSSLACLEIGWLVSLHCFWLVTKMCYCSIDWLPNIFVYQPYHPWAKGPSWWRIMHIRHTVWEIRIETLWWNHALLATITKGTSR